MCAENTDSRRNQKAKKELSRAGDTGEVLIFCSRVCFVARRNEDPDSNEIKPFSNVSHEYSREYVTKRPRPSQAKFMSLTSDSSLSRMRKPSKVDIRIMLAD